MGYGALDKCFGTPEAAAGAICQSYPKIIALNGVVTTYSCVAVDAGGETLQIYVADTQGGSFTTHAPLAFPTCDENMQVNDIGALWGAGLAALVAVYLVKQFVYKLVANQ